MEYEIQIFEHKKFKNIRGLLINGEPWLVAADVCRNLEVGNVSRAVSRLDDDEKSMVFIPAMGSTSKDTHGGQDMLIVNEPGFYRLIFASRKKEARDFQRWVYHEVLPSIRKTGSYSLEAKSTQADDTQAILSEVRSMFLQILEAVNSSSNAEKILNELTKAFKQFAQTGQKNGDFERGKILAKLVFALKASPKKEQLVFTAANLVMGEKAF